MSRFILMLTAAISIVSTQPVKAIVLSGPIANLPESSGPFHWGDGINNLYHEWSTNSPSSTGWFYASTYSWSNVDFYIYHGLTDPTKVSDATIFPYVTSGAMIATEGDTVFFRGTNGFYGAWRLDDFYPSAFHRFPYSYLNGRWYFQNDRSGSFAVPEPFSFVPLLVGGLVAIKCRRQGRST